MKRNRNYAWVTPYSCYFSLSFRVGGMSVRKQVGHNRCTIYIDYRFVETIKLYFFYNKNLQCWPKPLWGPLQNFTWGPPQCCRYD